MATTHDKPAQSQQGTFNSGTTQAFNAYKGTKSGQSGAVKVVR